MNECFTTPQHEKQIGYWVSVIRKAMHNQRAITGQALGYTGGQGKILNVS